MLVAEYGWPTLPPSKQAQLRGRLITQIKELRELLEAGAISLEEYNNQKVPILDKLHSLNISSIGVKSGL